jgi:hypothetical protein
MNLQINDRLALLRGAYYKSHAAMASTKRTAITT